MKARRATPRRRAAPQADRAGWEQLDAALQRRAGGRCECCGQPLDGRAERSHRQRRAVGGDRLANLLLVRPECHARHHARPAVAMSPAHGWQVSSYAADPAEVPVLWRGRRFVLLDDAGGMTPCPGPAVAE